MWTAITTMLLAIVAVSLIGIILLQRGRGGGLAGAFGMGGGDQAFGTKAATLAQKVTIVLAVLLLALTIASSYARSNSTAVPAASRAPIHSMPAGSPADDFMP